MLSEETKQDAKDYVEVETQEFLKKICPINKDFCSRRCVFFVPAEIRFNSKEDDYDIFTHVSCLFRNVLLQSVEMAEKIETSLERIVNAIYGLHP